MIPFPGESLRLFYAAAGADDTLGGDILYRGAEPNTAAVGYRPLASGDEWRVWVAPGSGTYLEESDIPLDIWWAVEVDSGTVTVSAAEGFDPEYGDLSATAPTPLGSHTFTGPGTLLIPSQLTTAQVWGDAPGALLLHLTATAGSAVVSQVKLRVWPAEGVAGGWSDVKPAWEQTTTGTVQAGTFALDYYLESPPKPDGASAYSALAALHGGGPPYYLGTPEDIGVAYPPAFVGRGYVQMTATPEGQVASVGSESNLILISGPDLAGDAANPIESGVTDYIRPPEEVDGDFGRYALVYGDEAFQWDAPFQRNLTIQQLGAGVDVGSTGGVFLVAWPGEWDGPELVDVAPGLGYQDAPELYRVPLYGGANEDVVTRSVALPTTARDVLITLSFTGVPILPEFSMFSGGLLGPATAEWRWDFDTTPPVGTITHPAYRVWSPTATRSPKLRQYNRDDGLGVAPRRAYGGASRSNTGRVYGYT